MEVGIGMHREVLASIISHVAACRLDCRGCRLDEIKVIQTVIYPAVARSAGWGDSQAEIAGRVWKARTDDAIGGSPPVEFIFFKADPWRLFNLLNQEPPTTNLLPSSTSALLSTILPSRSNLPIRPPPLLNPPATRLVSDRSLPTPRYAF